MTAATTLRNFITTSRTLYVKAPTEHDSGEQESARRLFVSVADAWSSHQHVLELLRVVLVDILREQPGPGGRR